MYSLPDIITMLKLGRVRYGGMGHVAHMGGDGMCTLHTKLQSPHLEGLDRLRYVTVHGRVPLDGFHKQDLRVSTGQNRPGLHCGSRLL
jgi:hypothetical protein